MPIVGINCPCSGQKETFATCIDRHREYSCWCHVPVYLLEHYANDKRSTTKAPDNTFSATELLQCPRTFRFEQEHDIYADPTRLWNMARGSWTHHMMESGPLYEGVFKERRIYKDIVVDGTPVRIMGTPDEVNYKRGVLVDYKTKHLLPKREDKGHEAQFNIYAWLLKGGWIVNYEEDGTRVDLPVDITIRSGGMHYVTWHTKEDTQFEKKPYPVWDLGATEALVTERARLFLLDDPPCAPYGMSPYWKCNCTKLEAEFLERVTDGI
jgi:hypothetical protein